MNPVFFPVFPPFSFEVKDRTSFSRWTDGVVYVDKKCNDGRVPLEKSFCNCFFVFYLQATEVCVDFAFAETLRSFPRYKLVKKRSDSGHNPQD